MQILKRQRRAKRKAKATREYFTKRTCAEGMKRRKDLEMLWTASAKYVTSIEFRVRCRSEFMHDYGLATGGS